MKCSNKIISSTLCMYLVLIFCWHTVFNLHYSMPHCTLLKRDVLNNTSGCVILHDLRAAVTH